MTSDLISDEEELNDDEMSNLRSLMRKAVVDKQEMSLSIMIEKALAFGDSYPWPDELEYAQSQL